MKPSLVRVRLFSLALSILIGASFALVSADAWAQPVVAVDGHIAVLSRSANNDSVVPGFGGAAILGYSLGLEPVLIIPEITAGLEALPVDNDMTFRTMLGVRVGLSLKVEPSVFAHAGYGFIKSFGTGTRDLQSAFAVDAGFALDYRVKKWFTVGGVIGWEALFRHDPVHAGFIGPRIGFWF